MSPSRMLTLRITHLPSQTEAASSMDFATPSTPSSSSSMSSSASTTAFANFRSYARTMLRKEGLSHPSRYLLAKVWSSMSDKEREPWRLMSMRSSVEPDSPNSPDPLDSCSCSGTESRARSPEFITGDFDMDELSARFRQVALDSPPPRTTKHSTGSRSRSPVGRKRRDKRDRDIAVLGRRRTSSLLDSGSYTEEPQSQPRSHPHLSRRRLNRPNIPAPLELVESTYSGTVSSLPKPTVISSGRRMELDTAGYRVPPSSPSASRSQADAPAFRSYTYGDFPSSMSPLIDTSPLSSRSSTMTLLHSPTELDFRISKERVGPADAKNDWIFSDSVDFPVFEQTGDDDIWPWETDSDTSHAEIVF